LGADVGLRFGELGDQLLLGLLQREVGALLLVTQALAVEGCAETRAQESEIERFAQIIVSSILDAANHTFELVERRYHDHRNVPQFLVVLDLDQDFKAAPIRHEHVEQNDVDDLIAAKLGQGFVSTVGLDDSISFLNEAPREQVAVLRIIVHYKNGGCVMRDRRWLNTFFNRDLR